MDSTFEYKTDIAWCQGCGNFGLRKIVINALEELEIEKEKLVFVSGIGQAAKSPQYLDVNYFNGLHGRALPPAAGIKAANPNLIVVVESGDGDMYGEGGNHFIHAIRRNPDITVIVHNNMVYGLTKGQASPTTPKGMKTPVQTSGVFEEPINPLAMAISLDASFVARGSVGEFKLTKDIIKKAITHRGFSLVDVFQACVTFNKINTHAWFKKNTYSLDDSHDPTDRNKAFELSLQSSPWPLGIFYKNEHKPIFEEELAVYRNGDKTPLYKRTRDPKIIDSLLQQKI
ncbi:2-oxoglutarate oxidoreductase, beta subunit [Chitinispirillum alkaliphilum]|nr:2-oxoglutarate oxidoreductase, beta subunit [Chitinispirillum alkaliphilum]